MECHEDERCDPQTKNGLQPGSKEDLLSYSGTNWKKGDNTKVQRNFAGDQPVIEGFMLLKEGPVNKVKGGQGSNSPGE